VGYYCCSILPIFRVGKFTPWRENIIGLRRMNYLRSMWNTYPSLKRSRALAGNQTKDEWNVVHIHSFAYHISLDVHLLQI
jgi:hypothetical protein